MWAITFALLICIVNAVQIDVSGIPDVAYVGVFFNFSVTTSNGVPPYRYSVQGDLPEGLTISSNGVISGTPCCTGVSDFRIVVSRHLSRVESSTRMLDLSRLLKISYLFSKGL